MTAHSRCQFCGSKFFSKKGLHSHRIAKGHMTRTMELPSSRQHRTEKKMQNQKPEYSYSDVLVKAGQTLPEALLSKLIAENRTAIGCGIRTQKEMEKEVFEVGKEGKTVEQTLAFMKKWFEATKAFTRIVRFHSLPPEFDETVEIGPWSPLKDSKGKPLMYVGIDGDFPEYIDKSADHFSEASRVLVDWLGPKIETIYGTAGNRPDKLFDYLKSADFGKDLEAIIGHRGVLSFLPITGEAFVQGKNEIGVSGDWGTASVAYGYTEAVTETASPAPKAEDVKPPEKKSGSKYVDDDTPAPVKEVPSQAPLNPGQELVEEEKVYKVPAGMHGKKLKEWYREVGGTLPSNWRDKPDVKVMVKKPVKADAPKKADTAMAAALASAEANKPPTLTMPIVAGDKQKAANEFVKKYVGDGSAIISDPAATAEQESKLAKWHELSGFKDLSEVNKYTTAFLAGYVKQHPEMAWLLIIELRSELNRHAKVIAEGDKKLGDLTGTEKAPSIPVPDTVQPEPEVKKVAGSKYL